MSTINIGDATAFNSVISVCISGLFGSYLIAAGLLLYRRTTGGIREPNDEDTLTNTVATGLTWGPWRLRGIFGILNNVFACIYLIFIFFSSFWPAYADVTPRTMNWAVLVTGSVSTFSLTYYFIWARRVYTGPIVEVELAR